MADRTAGIPKPGDVLDGKYRIEKLLGMGGMGVVLSATHMQLEQLVAIKVLTSAAAAVPRKVARFEREAWTASKISSDHVCRVIDVSKLPSGSPYMVMEYLEGEDLSAFVAREQMSVEDAATYLLQAMEALAEAHKIGVIHRDLKPGNLFMTKRVDGTPWIKVLDFGISKVTHSGGDLTRTRSIMGSPLYMAPEQMTSAKHVDVRSDIWPLGVILYELVSGVTPFDADTMPEICLRVLQEPAAPLREICADVPAAFDAAVMRCLDKDPARRFQNVAQLADALAPFAKASARESVAFIRRVLDSEPCDGAAPSAPSSRPDHDTGASAWQVENGARPGIVTTDPVAALAAPRARGGMAVALVMLGILTGLIVGVVLFSGATDESAAIDPSPAAEVAVERPPQDTATTEETAAETAGSANSAEHADSDDPDSADPAETNQPASEPAPRSTGRPQARPRGKKWDPFDGR